MIQINNDEQLKNFIKKEAERLNISVQNAYNTFFCRLLLYELSKNDKEKNILVKGSFAQLIHLNKMVRPITDIDIASTKAHNDPLLILKNVMRNKNQNIIYNYRNKLKQTGTGIYKIPICAQIGKINHPIGIDYRENYPIIYKKQVKLAPKIFENDEEYEVVVPSIEETLAEKLYVIVKKNIIYGFNTRMKDFYDVYQLHGGEYDLDIFSYCFEKMLRNSTSINIDDVSTDFLSKDFVKTREQEWANNKRKYEFLDDEIDLEGAVYYTRGVLSEQLQRIKQGKNKVYTLSNDKIV